MYVNEYINVFTNAMYRTVNNVPYSPPWNFYYSINVCFSLFIFLVLFAEKTHHLITFCSHFSTSSHASTCTMCMNNRIQRFWPFFWQNWASQTGRGYQWVDTQCNYCTLQRKSHLCIPFLGIARPQPQFPHSCVPFMCLWAIHIVPRSVYIFPPEE